MRNLIRSLTPKFLLTIFRKYKKKSRNRKLLKDKAEGRVLTLERLESDFRNMGVQEGMSVLVHSSMKSVGYLENGPATIIEALRKVIGPKGNILMPTSPNASYQIDYIQAHPVFDVAHTPSAMGAISEYFRKLPGVLRSAHPLEPVAAQGPDAEFLTRGHLNLPTAYHKDSPFFKIYSLPSLILYIGVTLDNAGTNLHTLEDAVDFPYPVYASDLYPCTILLPDGSEIQTNVRAHNPEWSKKRKCDQLIPMFESEGVLRKATLGEAPVLVADAPRFFESMIRNFKEKSITMYTPYGIS
jgi:aminoglycoside 3-N-acetyltransferase